MNFLPRPIHQCQLSIQQEIPYLHCIEYALRNFLLRQFVCKQRWLLIIPEDLNINFAYFVKNEKFEKLSWNNVHTTVCIKHKGHLFNGLFLKDYLPKIMPVLFFPIEFQCCFLIDSFNSYTVSSAYLAFSHSYISWICPAMPWYVIVTLNLPKITIEWFYIFKVKFVLIIRN